MTASLLPGPRDAEGPPASAPARHRVGEQAFVLGHDLPPALVVGLVAVLGSAAVGVGATRGASGAVAALIAAAGAVALLARPALGGLVLVATVPVLSGLARGLPLPGVKVSELLVAGCAGAVLLCSGRRHRVPYGALDLLLVAYVVATAAFGVWGMQRNGEPFSVDAATRLLAPVQFLLLFRAVRVAVSTPPLRWTAVRLLLLASIGVSLVALAQQLIPGSINPLLAELTASGRPLEGPSTGVFPGKHDLGGYLLVVVVLTTGLLLTPRAADVLGRRTLVACVVLSALALIASTALAAVGGTAVGVLLMARRRGALLRVLGGLVGVGVAAAVLVGPMVVDQTDHQFDDRPFITSGTQPPAWVPHGVAYRMTVWNDQYLPAITPHLATGYGPSLPPGVAWEYSESAYLTLVLRGGVPLLLLFLGLSIAVYLRAREASGSDDPLQQALGLAVAALVVVVTVIDLTNPYRFNAGLSQAFWVLAALVVGPGEAAQDGSVRARRR